MIAISVICLVIACFNARDAWVLGVDSIVGLLCLLLALGYLGFGVAGLLS